MTHHSGWGSIKVSVSSGAQRATRSATRMCFSAVRTLRRNDLFTVLLFPAISSSVLVRGENSVKNTEEGAQAQKPWFPLCSSSLTWWACETPLGLTLDLARMAMNLGKEIWTVSSHRDCAD